MADTPRNQQQAQLNPSGALRLTDVSSNHLALLNWVLERQGQDASQIFENVGISLPTANSPTDRVPLLTILKVMEQIDKLTDDPRVCLELYGHMKLAHLNVLGFALSCSSSLVDLFERVRRFSSYLSTAFVIDWQERSDHYFIAARWQPDIFREQLQHARNADRLLECGGYAAIHMLQEAYGERLPARKLYLPESSHPKVVAAFAERFDCQIERVSDYIGAELDKAICLTRLPGANPQLARINDEQLVHQIAAIDQSDILHRCEQLIIEAIPDGKASLKDIARELGMSERVLQETLKEKGQNFSDILNRIRKTLAVQYLQEGKKNISQIAYALGFDRPSNFSRAFRNWTGQSPREFLHKDH